MNIELRGVSKRFRETTALDRVTVLLESGYLYGFLGRNGIGKSPFARARRFPLHRRFCPGLI